MQLPYADGTVVGLAPLTVQLLIVEEDARVRKKASAMDVLEYGRWKVVPTTVELTFVHVVQRS